LYNILHIVWQPDGALQELALLADVHMGLPRWRMLMLTLTSFMPAFNVVSKDVDLKSKIRCRLQASILVGSNLGPD